MVNGVDSLRPVPSFGENRSQRYEHLTSLLIVEESPNIILIYSITSTLRVGHRPRILRKLITIDDSNGNYS